MSVRVSSIAVLTQTDPEDVLLKPLTLPRRRLHLSEIDPNTALNRRSLSLQQSSASEEHAAFKQSEERRSSLLIPPSGGPSRRRIFSARSENDPFVPLHRWADVSGVETKTLVHRPSSRLSHVSETRPPPRAFDGPDDRVFHNDARRVLSRSEVSHAEASDISISVDEPLSAAIKATLATPAANSRPVDQRGPWLFRPKSVTDRPEPELLVTGPHESRKSPGTSNRVRPSRPLLPLNRSSDRFIHPRRPGLDLRNNFTISRAPSRLTQRQRMTRRRTGLTDPLGPPVDRNHSQENHARRPQHPISHRVGSNTRITLEPEFEASFNSNGLETDSRPRSTLAGHTASPSTASHGSRSRPFGSGSGTRHHPPSFLEKRKPADDRDLYGKRLALALDVDLSSKVLQSPPASMPSTPGSTGLSSSIRSAQNTSRSSIGLRSQRTFWIDNEWRREGLIAKRRASKKKQKPVPNIAFRVLEADGLRDDYYCSVLAYSYMADRLAVGLGSKVYLWSEDQGLIHPPSQLDVPPPVHRPAYITSLAFSSEAGGKAILAVGRVDGRLMLWSPLDMEARFLPLTMPHSASHLAFRPQIVRRPSQRHESVLADNEVLLVGDDFGNVWVFLVEWPKEQDRFLYGWDGGLALVAKMSVHTQQICGIAWSSDGEYFATGGNDNLCCLFQSNVLLGRLPDQITSTMAIRRNAAGHQMVTLGPSGMPQTLLGPEHVRHSWKLTAAVKAIAFCPWQRGLVAAGGGSNDRCIHFYHTMSGACLATIDCAAQVTSVIWSTTRREVAATLGFPQPEHAYRIVVYAWPSCEQVAAITWHDEMRALFAIPYPGGPNEKKRPENGADPRWYLNEECLVVAGSDGSIKFHEAWSQDSRRAVLGSSKGLLGGSDILESLHGIEKDFGETIR